MSVERQRARDVAQIISAKRCRVFHTNLNMYVLKNNTKKDRTPRLGGSGKGCLTVRTRFEEDRN